MIVVSDTSPISYLVLIGQATILSNLYTCVAVPPAVAGELTHPYALRSVRRWATSFPGWLEIVTPKQPLVLPCLDAGEEAAIALAIEMSAYLVLIDDRAGRREALRRGLEVAGTLSILDDADEAGLLKFDEAVAKLKETSFRISQRVLAEIMRKRQM